MMTWIEYELSFQINDYIFPRRTLLFLFIIVRTRTRIYTSLIKVNSMPPIIYNNIVFIMLL